MITDHEILRAMFFSSNQSGQELEGAHASVCFMDEERLTENLLRISDRPDRARIRAMAKDLAENRVLKVGHVREFVMKLSLGDHPMRIKRTVMSEVFGPVGFNILPSLNKAMVDVRDAARLIPYLGYGPPETLFARDAVADLAMAMGYENISPAPFGTMLITDKHGQRNPITAYDLFMNDPYLPAKIPDYEALKDFQDFVRNNPVSAPMAQKLADFFDSPVTVGVRDVLRFLEGSRHPNIPWEQAKKVILGAFEQYGKENFLPPEIDYYTYWVRLTPQEVLHRKRANFRAATAFSQAMIRKLPLNWTMQWSDQDLNQLSLELLDTHFSYPVYDIEPYSGVISVTALKVALRLAFFLPVHLLNLDLPARRNPVNSRTIADKSMIRRFLTGLSPDAREEFLSTVNLLLWETDVMGGVRDGREILPFKPIETTFYSLQHKAQGIKEPTETVVEDTTLEDVVNGDDGGFSHKYPGLTEKLTVFFTLIYRYFLDTDFIPDLRPDRAGTDLFIKGIWGYKTKNLVLTGKTGPKGKAVGVMFIDNKDQFKQYRSPQDRRRPMGMAKYAMRLVGPLIEPAMQRSIGIFVSQVHRLKQGDNRKQHSLKKAMDFAVRYVAHVSRAIVDGAFDATRTALEDMIEDTRDGILSLLSSKRDDDG